MKLNFIATMILTGLLYLFVPNANGAIATAVSDTSITREIDEKILQEYRENPDFQYNELKRSVSNWELLMYKLKNWILHKLFSRTGSKILTVVFITALILGILLLILRGRYDKAWFSNNYKKDGINYLDPDALSEAKLDEMLDVAEQNNDFRLAVRLQYIKLIKLLRNLKLLSWKHELTNQQIESQLKNWGHQEQFAKLTRWFDYCWYGDFKPDAGQYQQLKGDFGSLKEQAVVSAPKQLNK